MPFITILKPHNEQGYITKTFNVSGKTNTLYRCTEWTSRTVELNSASEFLELTQTVAKDGDLYLVGHLKRPIAHETVKNMSSSDPVTVAWLDIDNINVHPDTIRERIPELKDATLLVHYSASQGVTKPDGLPVKNYFNYHIGILLSHPLPLGRWKQLLQYWSVKYFSDDTRLNKTKTSLLYPLDTAMARSSQKLTMRPPHVADDYKNSLADDRRIYLIEGETQFFPITSLPTLSPEDIEKEIKAHYKILRNAQGLSVPKDKMVKLSPRSSRRVANAVEPATLKYQDSNEEYSHYNFEDGDSCSYYHTIMNPEIMYCFKDDVLPFSHKEVDPISYEEACKRRHEYIAKSKKIQRMPFYNEEQDTFYTLFLDNKNKRHRVRPIKKQNIPDWCSGNKIDVPESLDILDVVFDPATRTAFDPAEGWVNTYCEPELTVKLPKSTTPTFNQDNILDALKHNPDTKPIYDLLWSSTGNDEHAATYVINWLYRLIVDRQRPGTAVVLHGTPGTGKDLFAEYVISELVGRDYSRSLTMDKIRGNFNEILEKARFVYLSETYISSRDGYDKINELKRLITTTDKEVINAKGIRQYQAYLHFGMFFFSNQRGFMTIEPNDRRFYVAPRQETPLTHINDLALQDNDWLRTFPHLLEKGTEEFAKMLFDYEFSTTLHRELDTPAKERLQIEAKTSVDAFFEAIANNNLDYFIEEITSSIVTRDADNSLTISNNDNLVSYIKIHMLPYLDKQMIMPVKDLCMLYVYITQDEKMKPRKFIAMAHKYPINIDLTGLRATVKPNRYHTENVIVTWKLTNCDLLEYIDNYQAVLPGEPEEARH